MIQHIILSLMLFLLVAHAQSDVQVPDITVFGGSRSEAEAKPRSQQLGGARLQRKKRQTLGETLANEPGVSSTYFGPSASRPVVRGLEGERVRLLQNGMNIIDASSASPDHAVALDVASLERVEILRGPGALLYGSNTIGGVVNLITNRVPEQIPSEWRGRAETKYSSTDDGRSGSLTLDSKLAHSWALHADGQVQAADDYHVPEEVGIEDNRVYNSFNRSHEYSLGTSYVFTRGFIGGSFSNYQSSYGTVAEEFVHINMWQQRYDLSSEIRDLGWIESVRVKNSYSRYKHDEIEEGARVTTFRNEGNETRVELRHREQSGFKGVIGLQAGFFDFEADGDESFLPNSENQNFALSVFERRSQGWIKPSFGLRAEATEIRSIEDQSFTAGSGSLGVRFQLDESLALDVNGSYTERSPNHQELFANGPHLATQIFEVGRRDLKKERAQAAEVSLTHESDQSRGLASVFVQDYNSFIALSPTGADDATSGLPIYSYQSVPARLMGAEFEYNYKLPSLFTSGIFEVGFRFDVVNGINRSTGEPLPRITPMRETIMFAYKADRFQADLEIQRAEEQNQTAPFETGTSSFTFVNLGAEIPVRFTQSRFSIVARANNILDQVGRNHASVSSAKEIAPLPGRNFTAGIQASF